LRRQWRNVVTKPLRIVPITILSNGCVRRISPQSCT
jgi:hypothetical protein